MLGAITHDNVFCTFLDGGDPTAIYDWVCHRQTSNHQGTGRTFAHFNIQRLRSLWLASTGLTEKERGLGTKNTLPSLSVS